MKSRSGASCLQPPRLRIASTPRPNHRARIRTRVPALTAAQLVGTHLVWERTIETGGGLLGRYDTRRSSRRQVERFLIHPNQIKRLTTGEAILITKQPSTQTRAMRVRPPQRWGRELG